MKLSKIAEITDLHDRHQMLVKVCGWFKDKARKDDPITIILGHQIDDEMIDREEAPGVFLALEAFFTKLKEEIEGDLKELGVEID